MMEEGKELDKTAAGEAIATAADENGKSFKMSSFTPRS
jgi:hypothetical protein